MMVANVRIAALLGSLLVAATSDAQTVPPTSDPGYAKGPVRIVVPYAAGGPTDTIARIIADNLSKDIGQQFYVENRAGASANIGTGVAAQAPGDGHTMLFVTNDFAAQPALSAKIPYDPVKSFVPVTILAVSPQVIVVHPSVPVKSLKELIALLNANPGKYSYATPGARTTTHLAAERLFRLSAGLDLGQVHFGGGGPAILSTFAGHTLIAVTALPPAAPYIKESTLRALAVTTSKRSQAFPDVPTLAEAGFLDQESDLMVGVVVPTATPKSIVDLWHRQIAQITMTKDAKDRLQALGFEVVASTQEEFAARIKAETAMWAKVAREANMQPQ